MKSEVPIMKSIRTKLIFWICVLFISIGILIYFPLAYILPRKIISQILKRDVEIARYLSSEAKKSLLVDDKVGLSLLLHDNLDKLTDARYIFIQGSDGAIIAHTFTGGFPRGLLSFGSGRQSRLNIKEFLNDGKKMYDIALPVLEGELGVLHLGVSLESGKKEIAEIGKINNYIAAVIFTSLGAGVFVFLSIGFIFSSQIIRLKNFASRIGQGDLEAQIDLKSRDEIGVLASAFNDMALNLKEKIRQIKRLNTLEERNKIAFDLHDGCAQHAANIIKRLELCERLFRIDPQKALAELDALRESTKDSLHWTRQMIFDLKSPEDADFSLLNRLKDYIIDYKKRSDINVRLNIPDSINNMQAEKARSIFYIVTEALSNIRKHSKARNVELHLEVQGGQKLAIDIKDDGEGFDLKEAQSLALSQGKWGLMSMRERTESLGGIFSIESAPGKGTRVSVSIPFSLTADLEEL